MERAPHPADVERSDADFRLIAALAAGIGVFLIGSPFLLQAVYRTATYSAGIENNLPRPAPPVLEIKPKLSLQAQRSREEALLANYGWADRDGHVARMPIERAMHLLAERGLPGWPPTATSSAR